MPAKWSAVTLRTQLPLVWMACICTVASSARISGTSASFGPVQLQVLARGEMPEAAVVAARDVGELAQLRGAQQSVGNGDAQHRRMALDIQAIAQAQRPELLLGQLARQVAARLVAELRDARIHEGLVKLVVLVHGSIDYRRVLRGR